MRWNDLPRSLVFGAVAAASWLAVAVFFSGTASLGLVLKLHAAVCLAFYLAGLAPAGRNGLRVGAMSLVVGLGIALFVPSPSTALLALGAVLAVGRSVQLWEARPVRALVTELLLVLGGLKLASLVGGPTIIGLALGYWTFFLVQGAFFLLGGVEARQPSRAGRDPCGVARERALSVLEGGA
jgi:hypothetical protein